jgi:hypothetical protein
LKANQNSKGKYKNLNKIGGNHPPKNKITNKLDIIIILLYSPKKNKAKITEAYSKL